MGGASSNWRVHLGSEHKVVVASLDGRGTSGRSEDFKFLMRRRLGDVEVTDQILGGELVHIQIYKINMVLCYQTHSLHFQIMRRQNDKHTLQEKKISILISQ